MRAFGLDIDSNLIFGQETIARMNSMFEKKRSGLSVGRSEEELRFFGKIKNLRLLRAVIDDEVELEFPSGYVPPMMEVEMTYSVIIGQMVGKRQDYTSLLKEIVRVIGRWQ